MKIRLLRRMAQASAILLLIAIPLLNKRGISVLMGSLYSLSLGPLWITDPLSGVQVIITTLTTDTTLLLSIALPVLATIALGRVFCSWICPQNALSEFFDYLSRRINANRLLTVRPSPWPRYLFLVILVLFALLLHFPTANLLSAPGIISVQISHYVYEGGVGAELGLIGLIIIAEFLAIRRLWCNYVCPVGGFLGLFRTGKTMKVSYREDGQHSCTRCGECVKACQLGLNPMGGKIYPLCHNCGDCIASCEKMRNRENPLSFKF